MVIKPHKIHQYRKVKLVKSVVFRCMLPGCTHYTREAFIINKIALCPFCGKDFLITRDLARRETVHCSECIVSTKPKVEVKEVVEFLEELKDDTTSHK